MPLDLIFRRRKPPQSFGLAVVAGLLTIPKLLGGKRPDLRRRKTAEVPFLSDDQLLVSEVRCHPDHRDECWATEHAATKKMPVVSDDY